MATVRADMIPQREDVLQRFINDLIEGWRGFLYGDQSAAVALIKSRNHDISDAIIERSM